MLSHHPLVAWFRRAMTAMAREAERGHGFTVQKRSWYGCAAAASATERAYGAHSVPALRHLDPLVGHETRLLRDIVGLAPTLPWRASERAGDDGHDVALVDLFECIDIDLAGAGLMLLGPGAGYPEHSHPPAEVYLVLHGSRRWRFGDSDRYRKIDAGQVLSNSSNDVHGVEPGEDVMLALWILMDDR